MRAAGVLNRVLISHDSGWYHVGQTEGGNYRGYTVIFNRLLPELRKEGFTDDDIEQILVRNPREAYIIKVRSL
jgi:phosphotriesterase-related protein